MADQKITELTEDTAPAITDLLATVEDPSGTPTTKKILVSSLIGLIYPVGSIYISVSSTNPGTTFGVGTWTAFGAGKVLVGLDSGDTDFDTVEETGGAKTHTLTLAEIPSHQHKTTEASIAFYITANGSDAMPSGSADSVVTNPNTGFAGGGGAHNNLQPYITVYMWKRTA